jgi:ABC-type branched-subunit amino acid transport system substrate-binding protein
MFRPTPLWRVLAVVAASGLVLAACGEDDEGATTQPTESPTGNIAQGDGELVVGTLLPQTGSLAFLGPPEVAGVNLAVKEINEAGGVLGKPLKKFESDSGDSSTDIASQSVDRLLSNKVDAIVGAASSSVSFTVIDKITGAGVVQFSPANTSPDFTDYADKGLYFRTAPSDVLQGRVLSDLVIDDGNTTVGILALQDAYGTGLAENVKKGVTDGGGEVVPEPIIYDPKAPNYAAEVGKIKAADPEGIVVIGFDETKKIIPELIKQGIGPKQKKIYFVDGNLSNTYTFSPDTLTGIKGTLPGAESSAELQTKLKEVDPKLKDFAYAPESYDAVTLIALAAEAADNDSGTAIASKLVEVSKGGTKCTTFTDCKTKLDGGEDIDYDGVSGPIEFSDKGDPTEATIGIYQYGKDNKYKKLEFRSGKL